MTDRRPSGDHERREFREEAESLVRITLGPLIWAAHFLLCYAGFAVVCAKGGEPQPFRTLLIGATAAALLAIVWTGWRALRQWEVRKTGDFTDPKGRSEDRHQFLGHAGFLLAIISAVGVIYVALPLFLVEGCG